MKQDSLKTPKLPRVVHWRSETGKLVVVSGPFPENFSRTETRKTPEAAAKITHYEIYSREATTRDDHYAKVAAVDIHEIHSGENDWGPVSP